MTFGAQTFLFNFQEGSQTNTVEIRLCPCNRRSLTRRRQGQSARLELERPGFTSRGKSVLLDSRINTAASPTSPTEHAKGPASSYYYRI